MYRKRLWACVLGGAVSAVICLFGRQIVFGFPRISLQTVAGMMANRVLLGFLPECRLGFVLYTSAGTLYGGGIERLATDVFKAPMSTVPGHGGGDSAPGTRSA